VPALTAELACERLGRAGFGFLPEALQVESRDERWLVRLPGERVAWFAASEEARRRLHIERRVLRLLDSRCTFRVPRVLFEDPAGVFDVRSMVPGGADPWQLYARLRQSPELAQRLGSALGAVLVEQHSRIGADDVAGWLPEKPSWPPARAWIIERLPRVIDDARLLADAERALALYEEVPVSGADRALVHADLGLHNLGIDGDYAEVHGVFDYDDAAWADRHHDFRYLVFDFPGDQMLDAARTVYEPAIGVTIQPERVHLYNAACALGFLAQRVGKAPDECSCGRTLSEDLRWSRHALERGLGRER
jgi:aminoglycoside phosphotransferase (APT) family kinase protein